MQLMIGSKPALSREPSRRKERVRLMPDQVCFPKYRRFRQNPVPSGPLPSPSAPNGYQTWAQAQMLAGLELIQFDLYDSVLAPTVATVMPIINLFTIGLNESILPIGAAANINKTLAHTNFDSTNRQLPAPQSLLVTSLRQALKGGSGLAGIAFQDANNIQFSTIGTFWAGSTKRSYFQGLMGDIPCAQNALTIQATGTTVTSGTALNFGYPAVWNKYSIQTGLIDPTTGQPDQGVVLNQGRTFYFNWDPTLSITDAQTPWKTVAAGGTTGGVGFFDFVFLCGVLAREIAG